VLPAGTVVDAAMLKSSGILSRIGRDGVKVLGDGEIAVALTLRVERISASAREKIVAAGGTVEAVA
jgi:large subunit ribosomal protein L15